MLRNGVAAQLQGCTLTVNFQQEFNRIGCQNKSDEIAKMFSAALGAQINLRFELQAKTSGNAAAIPIKSTAPGAPATAASTAPPAANKPMNSTKRQEVLDDPDIKTIIAGLGATVMNIELAREE